MDDVGAFRHLISRWAEETRQFCERLSALLDEHERLRETERQTDLTRREVDGLRAAVRDLTAEQAAITATLRTLQREHEELRIDHEVLTALLRTQHEAAAPAAAGTIRPSPMGVSPHEAAAPAAAGTMRPLPMGVSRGPDIPPIGKVGRIRFVEVFRRSGSAG
jgi:hypothetical protein